MSTLAVDGTVFTGIYTGLLAATTAVAVLVDRRPGWPAGPPVQADDLDEYELAYLTEGPRLAAVVALVNLDRRGAIDLGDDLLRQLHDSGDLDLVGVRGADHLAELGVELHATLTSEAVASAAVNHPVESAALQAVRGTKPPTPWRVVSAITRTKALTRVREGLVDRGLLHEWAQVDRLRARWRWLLPLLALGGVRLVGDLSSGEPVALLLLAMAATVLAMVVVARREPENTRRGDRLLAEARRRQAEVLDPAPAGGGAASGLALALAGIGGLWGSDPALALAVDAPAPPPEAVEPQGWFRSAREWWDGHARSGGAGCGWGSGWGGGGHGCGGGGHGCGGGGHGCGGGGCGGGG